MTPLDRCVRQIDNALTSTQSSVVEDVAGALDSLEAAFVKPAECIMALETVLHAVKRRRRTLTDSPTGRFIFKAIDQRQDKILREAA